MEHPDTSFQGTSEGLRRAAQIEWGKILYASGARTDALRHARSWAQRDAKARLLGTRWASEASLLLPRVAEVEFQEAKEQLRDSEAAYFYHASYLDGLLKGQISEVEAKGTARSEPNCPFDRKNLVSFTVRGYLQALQRGTKRVHFILNRVLQLAWECCEVNFQKAEVNAELMNEARAWHGILAPRGRHAAPGRTDSSDRVGVAAYAASKQAFNSSADDVALLVTAMFRPLVVQTKLRLAFDTVGRARELQALGRHDQVKFQLEEIIKSVVVAFPDPAGWHLMQLLKSDDKGHQQLGKELLSDVGRQERELHTLFSQRARITEDLISLANCNGQALRLSKTFPRLAGVQSSRSEKWRVLVPLQGQMTATIPRINSAEQIRSVQLRSFFPEAILTERCLEHVEVFRSKEKPKKLTFLGSDGLQYPFLCKAEKRGDLRKDSRLMEFAAMVNQLLAKSPDANRRNLEVRTFQVVILSEKCGLIEWVPNTKGLRHVIDDLWKGRKNPRQSLNEVKELFDRSKDIYETFTRQVLPRNPPILHRWFARSGDPSVWLAKRSLFSQSQALWCMLGYLVGLGDRHGENILIDTESGRMVHVDFDCLFGKGMLLERPEMVPFRLTQNCVAAMGITGVEGTFRQCCEVTMEVLRDRGNTQTLLSVLHVFVADPLLEITRKGTSVEHRVQTARDTIGDVEKKLNGMLNVGALVPPRGRDVRESVLSKDERLRSLLGRDRGAGLSVQGQVDELIKAAMCKRNLSQMYVGWQPWL
ncbi:unnamed protein product [Symbiodinium natans]|uniref:Serine/threonine-protein kinase ATR n=1 Tax=Symbiodinium natans TaxID=878477 RepID=A0A812U2D4_9DINO|nr:unnamed protein product [Symbiodinium natans]